MALVGGCSHLLRKGPHRRGLGAGPGLVAGEGRGSQARPRRPGLGLWRGREEASSAGRTAAGAPGETQHPPLHAQALARCTHLNVLRFKRFSCLYNEHSNCTILKLVIYFVLASTRQRGLFTSLLGITRKEKKTRPILNLHMEPVTQAVLLLLNNKKINNLISTQVKDVNRHFFEEDTGVPRFTAFCFIVLCRHCIFYKLKACGNPALSDDD